MMLIPLAFQGIQMGMGMAGVGQPSPSEAMAKQQAMMAEQAKQSDIANKAAQQKQAAGVMQNAAPTLQEQLGGAVAPDYLMDQLALLGGMPGNTNVSKGVLSSWLGQGASDMGGGGGGGLNNPSPTPGSTNPMPGFGGGGGFGGDSGTNMFPSQAVPAYDSISGGSL